MLYSTSIESLIGKRCYQMKESLNGQRHEVEFASHKCECCTLERERRLCQRWTEPGNAVCDIDDTAISRSIFSVLGRNAVIIFRCEFPEMVHCRGEAQSEITAPAPVL
jgi:hypothetical protein